MLPYTPEAEPEGTTSGRPLPLPLAFLAHELRAPLATLQGAALTLVRRRDALNPETRDRLLADIAAEAERLAQLVGNLLELCQDGDRPRLTEPVALRPLVRRVLRAMAPSLSRHRTRCRLPAGTPPVEADPVALEQVLRNLMENAVRYTPPGALIAVTARSEGGMVLLRIADRGPGIPEAERERVFQPYVRLPNADRRGVGLGLAVCRRLVETQRGTIHLEGRRGPGTAVVVALPAAQE